MSKGAIVRLSAGIFLLGGVWLAFTQNPNQPAKLDSIKVKDDLYVIHNDFVPGNTTALITDEGVLLVDDKFEVDHSNIMAEVKKIASQPVKYVVNTHHHADHTGGNRAMQKMDVEVVSSEQARENMVDAKQPGLPTVTFKHEALIHLGGKTVELYQFGRAHTNGDVVVYFPADRTLAAGDMFTFGSDVPELIDYAGGGSGKEWTRTLDSALALDFDTVVPGHGPVTSKREMIKFRDSTLALRNRVHEMLVQNKTRDDVALMLKTEFHWQQLHLNLGLDGALAEMR